MNNAPYSRPAENGWTLADGATITADTDGSAIATTVSLAIASINVGATRGKWDVVIDTGAIVGSAAEGALAAGDSITVNIFGTTSPSATLAEYVYLGGHQIVGSVGTLLATAMNASGVAGQYKFTVENLALGAGGYSTMSYLYCLIGFGIGTVAGEVSISPTIRLTHSM